MHSGYVYPSRNQPSAEVIVNVEEPGFWAQVCVPIAQAWPHPGAQYASRKLYYGTVYRVVRADRGPTGEWWYQLQEGISFFGPGPYVSARSLRRIPSPELSPISLGYQDKMIRIDVDAQLLTCYEGKRMVFYTRIGSGVYDKATPHGEFTVLFKRHTSRMIGGDGDEHYDLPGIAFPTYFTYSGVAIHGTYWHNDFGRRHSHGCVNVTNDAARWVFRWADPVAPYGVFQTDVKRGKGTRVVVV